MSKIVSVINKSIHVEDFDDDGFTVRVYVNGKFDAGYGFGTREWAERLAKTLADNDYDRFQWDTLKYATSDRDSKEVMNANVRAAAELCRKYPPSTGIDSKSEFERFSKARELIVAENLKDHLPDDSIQSSRGTQ